MPLQKPRPHKQNGEDTGKRDPVTPLETGQSSHANLRDPFLRSDDGFVKSQDKGRKGQDGDQQAAEHAL